MSTDGSITVAGQIKSNGNLFVNSMQYDISSILVEPGTTGTIFDNYSVVEPFARMYFISHENTNYYLTLGTSTVDGAIINIQRIGNFPTSTFTINYYDPSGNPQNIYSRGSTIGMPTLHAEGNSGLVSTSFIFHGNYNTGSWYQLF
jgi:hypothetical protein